MSPIRNCNKFTYSLFSVCNQQLHDGEPQYITLTCTRTSLRLLLLCFCSHNRVVADAKAFVNHSHPTAKQAHDLWMHLLYLLCIHGFKKAAFYMIITIWIDCRHAGSEEESNRAFDAALQRSLRCRAVWNVFFLFGKYLKNA